LSYYQLWTARITAGAEQHGLEYHELVEGLHKNNVQLNRKSLADLAAWEPATFEALAKIGKSGNN
jgi:large subunit ribosomal protein L20